MPIDGPIRIAVTEPNAQAGPEPHIGLTPDFRALDLRRREILNRQPGWQRRRVPRARPAVIDVFGPGHELIRRHREALARAVR